MIYITIGLLLLFLTYHFDYKQNRKGRCRAYALTCFILICVAGLRYRIGVDSIRYESAFSEIPSILEFRSSSFSDFKYDPAYLLLAVLAKTISSSFISLQFIQAIFVNVIIFFFFKKYTKHIFLAVTVYYVFLYLNFMCEVMREACAVCCLLLAYPYFNSQQWGRYYIFAVLCALFHTSGLIAIILPICTLPGIRKLFVLGKRTLIISLLILVLSEIIRIKFFEYIQAITLMEKLQDKASMYAESDLAGTSLNLFGILNTLIAYVIYPVTAIILLSNNKRTSITLKLEIMVVTGIYMAIISIPIALFYRFNNYFFPFAILVVCDVCFNKLKIKRNRYKLTYLTWIFVMLPWFGLRYKGYTKSIGHRGLTELSRYYPYASRIFPEKDKKREQLFNFYHAE